MCKVSVPSSPIGKFLPSLLLTNERLDICVFHNSLGLSMKRKLWIVLELHTDPTYIFGRLQAVVEQSTVFPMGSRTLRSQTWLCKTTQEITCRLIQLSNQSTQLHASFCEAMSGFAKLLSPKVELWILALLVGVLHLCNAR